MCVPVRATNEVDVGDDAGDDVSFVDAETLVLPEIAVDNALADWLLHYGGGVEAIGSKRAGGAAFIKEALFVGAVVRHYRYARW